MRAQPEPVEPSPPPEPSPEPARQPAREPTSPTPPNLAGWPGGSRGRPKQTGWRLGGVALVLLVLGLVAAGIWIRRPEILFRSEPETTADGEAGSGADRGSPVVSGPGTQAPDRQSASGAPEPAAAGNEPAEPAVVTGSAEPPAGEDPEDAPDEAPAGEIAAAATTTLTEEEVPAGGSPIPGATRGPAGGGEREPGSIPPPASGETGLVAIQVASFRTLAHAEKVLAQVQARTGLGGAVLPSDVSGVVWHRILLGAFTTEEEAREAALPLLRERTIDEIVLRPVPDTWRSVLAGSGID
jgi:hypothetical protein